MPSKSPAADAGYKYKLVLEQMNKAMMELDRVKKQIQDSLKKQDTVVKKLISSSGDADKKHAMAILAMANKSSPMLLQLNKISKQLEQLNKLHLAEKKKIEQIAKK